MKELELKQVDEYDNLKVSNCGKVFSFSQYGKKGGELKQFKVKGYFVVSCYLNGKMKQVRVHRLIAKAFLSNPHNKPQVNHIDGDKLNNYYKNLEWVTASENTLHAYKLGLLKPFNKGRFGYESTNGVKISQYTVSGKYIRSFGSLREAQRITGVNHSGISLCINNKLKKSGGFLWKRQ